jgi:transcriptional regulator with XRE-family HTH domain
VIGVSDESSMVDVGANVAAEIRRRRRTQRQLARELGVTESYLARRLSDPDKEDHQNFDSDELIKVARFLQTSVAELLGEEARSA